MALQTFEDLEVWKRGCRLAVEVCVEFDECKNFTLKDQAQRSAISIPSNIAEGSERGSDADFVRFLRYSKGSCAELRTQLYIARKASKRLNRPNLDIPDELITETREISAMLRGLVNSIEKRRHTTPQPQAEN
ncbi:MAG: four helix bundle protein [Verrucomicrobiaceae bacterium]|nr:four helix bundle protein [Verrucomicrobiaceae bacterium]